MTVDVSLIPQERIKDLISTLDTIQSNINNIGTDLTNNLVHKTGNETITGIKTHNIVNCDIYKSTVMDITNNPSEAHTIGINYADKNGNVHGQSFLRTESNGNVIQAIACLNHSQTSWAQFSVGFDSSDNRFAYLNGNIIKAFLTEAYISGTNWYRIWSDGWIEQGGCWTGSTGTTVTLLKAFRDTNWTLAFANWGGTCYARKSGTNQIVMHDIANANSQGYSWYACGY